MHSLPTAELAFPLFSSVKWLLKWIDFNMFVLSGAIWKGNGTNRFQFPAARTNLQGHCGDVSFQEWFFSPLFLFMLCVCLMQDDACEVAVVPCVYTYTFTLAHIGPASSNYGSQTLCVWYQSTRYPFPSVWDANSACGSRARRPYR